MTVASDRKTVELQAVVIALDDRFLCRRLSERRVKVRFELVVIPQKEQTALSTRVRRFEDGRQTDRLEGGLRFVKRPNRSKLRLRDTQLGELAAHRDLVRHQVGGLAPDPGQAEVFGNRGDDRNGAIGGDRENAVDRVTPSNLCDRRHVSEVDDLRDVGDSEPGSVRVAVDGDDAQFELARTFDRMLLVASRADEQHRFHRGDATGPAQPTV